MAFVVTEFAFPLRPLDLPADPGNTTTAPTVPPHTYGYNESMAFVLSSVVANVFILVFCIVVFDAVMMRAGIREPLDSISLGMHGANRLTTIQMRDANLLG